MALSTPVHKDLYEYKAKVIGTLTARTLTSIITGVGVCVITAIYLVYVLGLPAEKYSSLMIILALPFWMCGFWFPHGLPAEKFVALWLRENFTAPHSINYRSVITNSGDVYSEQESKNNRKEQVYDKFTKKELNLRGIEAYSPKAGRVVRNQQHLNH